MGIELPYGKIVAVLIKLTPLITGYYPRGYARRAKNKNHGACIVRTEAFARAKKEVINAVPSHWWWFQRVAIRLLCEVPQHR